MLNKVKNRISVTKQVLKDCTLENGAIISGHSGDPEYPKYAPNYMFVWPRDAAYVTIALNILGMKEKTEKFFRWCQSKAMDSNGMFWQHYTPNGLSEGFLFTELYEDRGLEKIYKFIHPDALYPISKSFRSQLQPDGNGLLLWALKKYGEYGGNIEVFEELGKNLADGICNIWGGDSFKFTVFGLWEEKIGYPGVNLIYTLATSMRGLDIAEQLFGKKEVWSRKKNEIKEKLQPPIRNNFKFLSGPKYEKSAYNSLFSDFFSGKNFNPELDASLLFLIWPGKILKGKKSNELLDLIEKNLTEKQGFFRYPGDTYDGIFKRGASHRTGGNSWPLLNLWTAICLSKEGEKDRSEKYYRKTLELENDKISEQVDEEGRSIGASPLAWAHALFIVATEELDYLET